MWGNFGLKGVGGGWCRDPGDEELLLLTAAPVPALVVLLGWPLLAVLSLQG